MRTDGVLGRVFGGPLAWDIKTKRSRLFLVNYDTDGWFRLVWGVVWGWFGVVWGGDSSL